MPESNDYEANEVEYWAAVGNLRMVKRAVADGHDIDAVAVDGHTAMHAAAENNHMDVLEYLVEQGANIQPKMESGETPRELARIAGCSEAEEYLSRVEMELKGKDG